VYAEHKAVLNVRLSGEECNALRTIAERKATERNKPVSLAATVRSIVRHYIQSNGGGASTTRGNQYDCTSD